MRTRALALLLGAALVMSAAPWTMADTGAPSEPQEVPAAPLVPGVPSTSVPPAAPPFARLPLPVAAPMSTDGNELDRMLLRLDEEERSQRAEIDQITNDLDVTRRRITARARAYYKHVRAGFLPAGGGFDALVDYAATVERTRRALERDRAAESDLLQRSEAIRDKLARMRVMRAPLEVQREAMNRARLALQQADERRAAFSRAFESSVRPPDYMAIYGADTGPTTAEAAGGFRSQKGRLPMPITGRAEVRRVTRAGSNSPGIELSGVPGATARSVAPGRVVFADRHNDYGMTVLLDHGDSYYSLYGDLSSLDVHVGDTLAGGSRIGSPSETSRTSGHPSTLYFELRHGADTIDPAPWLGL